MPPYAPRLLFPANNEAVDVDRLIRFEWRYSHPTNVPQARFQVRVRRGDADADVWGTPATVASPSSLYDRPAGTYPSGFTFEWQVRTQANDSSLEWSPWSSSGFFFGTRPVADHSFTAPPVGATIEQLVYTWSTPDQDAYQFLLTDSALTTTYYYSGVVVSRLARTKFIPFASLITPIPNGGSVRASVRVRTNGTLWSLYASQNNTFVYTPPRTPVARLYVDARAITVEAVDPIPFGDHPRVVDHVLERRVLGTAAWQVVPPRPAVVIPPNGSLVDYSVASAQDYEYRWTSIGTNGTTAVSDPVSEQWVSPENVPNAWPTFAEGFDAEPKNS